MFEIELKALCPEQHFLHGLFVFESDLDGFSLGINGRSMVWIILALVSEIKKENAVYARCDQLAFLIVELCKGDESDDTHVQLAHKVVHFVDKEHFEVRGNNQIQPEPMRERYRANCNMYLE